MIFFLSRGFDQQKFLQEWNYKSCSALRGCITLVYMQFIKNETHLMQYCNMVMDLYSVYKWISEISDPLLNVDKFLFLFINCVKFPGIWCQRIGNFSCWQIVWKKSCICTACPSSLSHTASDISWPEVSEIFIRLWIWVSELS